MKGITAREKAKDIRLRKEFHITLEEFNKVLKYQDGKCAICKEKFTKKGKTKILFVDHQHSEPAEVRGLLCYICNKGIAVLQDKAESCYNAFVYLKNPPFRAVLGKSIYTAPGKIGSEARKKRLAKMPPRDK